MLETGSVLIKKISDSGWIVGGGGGSRQVVEGFQLAVILQRPRPSAGEARAPEGATGKWWRRRESNPRPEAIRIGIYVCIP
jgi:hypothetical protein